MKFGSVKFFKRVIVAVFVLILLVPAALAVWLGVLSHSQGLMARRIEELSLALSGSPAVAGGAERTVPPQTVQAPPALPAEGMPPSFDYQAKYPELYARRPEVQTTDGKVCYLTFDDGPSPVTERVLDVLEAQGVKATFFVTGENSGENAQLLRRAAEEGHTIGVHSYSHDYGEIYASVDAYLDDFERMYSAVLEITGEAPSVFRFPGGSVNVYNAALYTEIIAEMTRRGFVFFDWNAAASDAVRGGVTREEAVNNVLAGAAGRERAIVLMHDRRDNGPTADALPDIIEGLRAQGYGFAPLTAAVQPIIFYYE